MAFLSANSQDYKRRLNLSDPSMPMDGKPTPGLVTLDGKAYLVEKGLRGATPYAGQEGATQYEGGTEDWMWRDPKTGQEHYLSDYADKGAKLYDTSEQGIAALREREGRGVFNRGGADRGAWVAGMSGPNGDRSDQISSFDVAEQADDADSMGYLTRINPTVRKQIFDAAGVAMPANLSGLSKDDLAKIERTMYKVDPMSFGGSYSDNESNFGQGVGQASIGGVDPLYGRRTANKGGEYFKNPENLKFDPNYGLYNDGSAGFVGRPKQSALAQGMPFMMAAAALMGGAAMGAFGAEASMAGSGIGTGAELGYGSMLTDSAAGAGAASEGLSIPGITQPLNITGNKIADSALTGMGRNAIISGATGRGITPQGLITSGITGGISGALPDSLGTLGKFGVSAVAGGLIGRAMGGGAGETTTGAVSGAVGNGNPQQVSQNSTGGFALGRVARETWGV